MNDVARNRQGAVTNSATTVRHRLKAPDLVAPGPQNRQNLQEREFMWM
jgi:hypothetical protein